LKTSNLPIISVRELFELKNDSNLILIDASNAKNALERYNEKHLNKAIFVDLNVQMANINADVSIGGRHPLPKVEDFVKTLESIGISKESHLVIYDFDNGANAAARLWWMLKAIGHEKVQVLNGGFQEAEKLGFPINSDIENHKKSEYVCGLKNWELPLITIEAVEKATKNENFVIIDVRESKRFLGEFEPIDLVAGHIPNAINIPFRINLDENGLFLPPNELKKVYETIFQNFESENIIVHCGSGVTACHSILAMNYAGFEFPKLYVGSWSEWSRRKI